MHARIGASRAQIAVAMGAQNHDMRTHFKSPNLQPFRDPSVSDELSTEAFEDDSTFA